MSTTSAQNTNAANELALISYIKNNDPNFIHMYVEPPPSYPSQSMGGALTVTTNMRRCCEPISGPRRTAAMSPTLIPGPS